MILNIFITLAEFAFKLIVMPWTFISVGANWIPALVEVTSWLSTPLYYLSGVWNLPATIDVMVFLMQFISTVFIIKLIVWIANILLPFFHIESPFGRSAPTFEGYTQNTTYDRDRYGFINNTYTAWTKRRFFRKK